MIGSDDLLLIKKQESEINKPQAEQVQKQLESVEQQNISVEQPINKTEKKAEDIKDLEAEKQSDKEKKVVAKKVVDKSVIDSLKKETVLDLRNGFEIMGGYDYSNSAPVEQVKAQKKEVDLKLDLIKKAMAEFSSGSGGKEFEAVQSALLALLASQKDNEIVEDVMYENVRQAAMNYVRTHDRKHWTKQGSRRFTLAQALMENVSDYEYLQERSKELKKEIVYAEDEASAKYLHRSVSGIKSSARNLKGAKKSVRKAFAEYTKEYPAFVLLKGEKLGRKKREDGMNYKEYSYTPYEIMNGLYRGVFTKDELMALLNKPEHQAERKEIIEKNGKKYEMTINEVANINKITDAIKAMETKYSESKGMKKTVHLYRGMGVSQIGELLNIPRSDLKALSYDADKIIRENPDNAEEKIKAAEAKKAEVSEKVLKAVEQLPGKVFLDKGFISTSMEYETASKFTCKKESSIWLMLDIVARKDSKALDVESVSDFDEKELLFAPNTKFRIHSYTIENKDGTPYIKLRVETR